MELQFLKNGFVLDGNKYKFGSQFYPLSNLSKLKCFFHDNTLPLPVETVDKLDELFHNMTFETGNCYENAKTIHDLIKKNYKELKPMIYTGWIFPTPSYPVHHSFVVLNQKHIVDPGVPILELEYMLEQSQKNSSAEEIAKGIANIRNSSKNNRFSEQYVLGKGYQLVIYYASPDTYENSLTIRDYINRIAHKHPSYKQAIQRLNSGTHFKQLIQKEQ
ncbi:hypothetical protein [Bacillus cereus group sp. BfR-BA-01317]|uniref:hypothetical protein n=1 Tax=Bacillus cereus group sp. BfR-BA-01317 TaxID=2920294 RepID=UPI001F5798A2|nr:hypothetical protein [Bacillus cereus group sp. BfR-BA-01317]